MPELFLFARANHFRLPTVAARENLQLVLLVNSRNGLGLQVRRVSLLVRKSAIRLFSRPGVASAAILRATAVAFVRDHYLTRSTTNLSLAHWLGAVI